MATIKIMLGVILGLPFLFVIWYIFNYIQMRAWVDALEKKLNEHYQSLKKRNKLFQERINQKMKENEQKKE